MGRREKEWRKKEELGEEGKGKETERKRGERVEEGAKGVKEGRETS